ncbi:MAG: ABC transporter permease, partial [Anaeroplasmataceae bacterium]
LNKKSELGYTDVEKRLYSDAYVNERKIYLMVSENTNEISVPAKILSGSYPSDFGVLLSESFAKRRSYKVGDEILMTVKISLKQMIPNSSGLSEMFRQALKPGCVDVFNDSDEVTLKFVVTGIMSHAESLGNLASSPGLLYMNMDTLRLSIFALIGDTYNLNATQSFILGKFNSYSLYNQFVFKGGNIDNIRSYLNELDILDYIATRDLMPGNQAVEMDIDQSLSLCFVFPIIFYIVGVLVIIASIEKQIDKDKQYIGTLSAIGVSRKTIVMHYVKISMLLVGIGGILGLIIGPLLIPKIMGIKYGVLYKIPDAHHPIFYIEYLICFIIIFLISLLVTIILTHKYVSKNPTEVLRDSTTKPFKGSIFERISFFNKHMSYSLKMALRNIKRRMSRSILVIIGVLGCTALLICGFGIEDTLNYGLELELSEKITYDNEVLFSSGKVTKSDIYNASSDITYVEEFQYSVVMASFNDAVADTTLTILENESKCYTLDCPLEGVTLSKKLAESLNIKVGDTITIHHSNKAYEMKVTNIISMFMSQGIYCRMNAVPFELKTNRFYCIAKDGSDLNKISEDIELVDGVIWSNPIDTKIETANTALSSIRTITLVVKVFAILLAIVVVYNLAVLNFKERTREMATMKVLGYGYKDISKMLTYEILILTIIGGIIGMFFGLPLLYSVMSINEPPMINYIYHINWYSYIFAILITCGVSVLLNLLISLKIKSIKMVESLKSVE